MFNRIIALSHLSASRYHRFCVYSVLFIGLLALIPAWAIADQNNPELAPLFDTLQKTQSNSETKRIQSNIWRIWLDAPDESSDLLITQIAAAMSLGQNQLALQLSNQLVDSAPEFAEGWNKRATIQYLLGNHGLSVADIKETLLLEPRHFGALTGLGMIFLSSGNYEAALDAFGRVLQLSPGSKNAQGSVARVRSLIGEDI